MKKLLNHIRSNSEKLHGSVFLDTSIEAQGLIYKIQLHDSTVDGFKEATDFQNVYGENIGDGKYEIRGLTVFNVQVKAILSYSGNNTPLTCRPAARVGFIVMVHYDSQAKTLDVLKSNYAAIQTPFITNFDCDQEKTICSKLKKYFANRENWWTQMFNISHRLGDIISTFKYESL